MTAVVWFRRDLRLADNPAWTAAAAQGAVAPLFILDDVTPGVRKIGAASRWWLHHSLRALDAALDNTLILRRGDPLAVLEEVVRATGATAVFWNRLYEPGEIARDKHIKAALEARGVSIRTFNALLLNEPWELKTGAGEPYKVFTPYWRAAQKRQVEPPLQAPRASIANIVQRDRLDAWRLTPRAPDWAKAWTDIWTPGERGAHARLMGFVEEGLSDYGAGRDQPDRATVSRLSPHLHWGEVSPRQALAVVAGSEAPAREAEAFARELYWREFSHHLLFHYPDLPERNWRSCFDAFPWRTAPDDLKAWRSGRTGYPFVDAGMRELWATGYMHNRARMVAASFLVKHLRIHWREGEAWFWDTLVDADLANNSASWQWVAGSGADAAPYFRIFNPVSQGRKCDPSGAYVRRWIPELAKLPDKFLHAPFEAPEEVLQVAGVTLGRTYAAPIATLAPARDAALAGYEAVRQAARGGAS